MRKLGLPRFVLAIPLAVVLISGGGCAGGSFIRTQEVTNISEITGLYTLILYHDAEYKGLQTMAFLDVEGDGYSLVPFAPDYTYTAIRNISGQEALRMAVAFISKNSSYMNSEISRISYPPGKTIGYEIRPLYNPLDHGLSDVLDVSYSLQESGIIKVKIKLLKSVESEFTDL